MTNATKQYFKGYNVRGLLPNNGITREEFKQECRQILIDTVNEALKAGGSPAKGTEEYKRIKKEATLAVYRKLSLKSTYFLFVIVLGNSWADSDYTYRLCLDVDNNKWMSQEERRHGQASLWVIAREHLKSTIITCASTLRELLVDSNRTFCIFSYNKDTAVAFLSMIKKWMSESELLKQVFPDILWDNPEKQYEDDEETGMRTKWRWTQTEIEVKRTIRCKEASIAASGISGGAMTGYHYQYLIFDDAETKDMVLTSEFIQQIVESITNTFNCGQTANLNVCFVGTFYAREDIYCRMIKDRIIGRCVLQPCYDEDGKSIYYTDEQLEAKRRTMTPLVWATQMLCDPSMSSNNAFDPTWIKRWTPKVSKNLNIYTFVDPAKTKTNKSDNTSILTVGYDAFGKILVLDMIRDKLNLDEKFDRLKNIQFTYNPRLIFYEEVGMQADIDYLRRVMDINTCFLNIQKITPKGDKFNRIDATIVGFQNGEIYLPEKCWHRNWQGIMEDMVESFIQDEFTAYPQAQHDDVLDTIAMAFSLRNDNTIPLPQLSIGYRDDIKEEEMIYIEDYDPMQCI